jgi:hypothetical protein
MPNDLLRKPNFRSWKINADDYPMNGAIEDKAKFFLRYALLAVSANNAQPWLFSVTGDEILVKYNPAKLLLVMDVYNRSLYIGIGDAIANLEVAANFHGYGLIVEYLLQDTTVARIKLYPTDENDDGMAQLFPAITLMRTNRQKRLQKAIPQHIVEELQKIAALNRIACGFVQAPEEKTQVGDLVVKSINYVFSDTQCRRDLAKWVKNNYTSAYDGMPAYTKGIPDLPSFVVPFILKYVNIGSQHATSAKCMVESSDLVVILGSSNDMPQEWLQVGVALQKIALACTNAGLAVGILMGPVEFDDLRAKLVDALHLKFRPQIILGIGYCSESVQPSPRHQLEQLLLTVAQ